MNRWTVTDRTGREIYLTQERWEHILSGHFELTGRREDVLKTIRLGRRKQMKKKPSWLVEKKITLPDGASALWSYDTEGDFLEIFFHEAPASGTVELADGVYLRFDREKARPLSLGFTAVTPLTQQHEFGPPLLTLTGLNRLPESERKVVLKILQSSPVNSILKVYSFEPKPRARVIPVASLSYPVPLAA